MRQSHPEIPTADRVRRGGVDGRPHRDRGRPRGAAPRRQRGRRRGRRRRHARRDRAVLRRHRRRRLLRLLRRPHPARCTRSTVARPRPPRCARTRSSTPTPARRMAFQEARVSGISVGVPGTLLTWKQALRKWGTRSLGQSLAPAADVAERGFTVDATFRQQVADNAAPFAQFDSTSAIYLPGGAAAGGRAHAAQPRPRRHLSRDRPARHGRCSTRARSPRDIVDTVQHPPVADEPGAALAVADPPRQHDAARPRPLRRALPGADPLRLPGLRRSTACRRRPAAARRWARRSTSWSSSTCPSMTVTEALHHYLEASALSFADRNRYVGDDTSRRLLRRAARRPLRRRAGLPDQPDGGARQAGRAGQPRRALRGLRDRRGRSPTGNPGQSTTNLTVADRWGNVVEYTLTIEQTGGNAMVVPGRGFLLNNELTDFNFIQTPGAPPDPNLPAPGQAAAQLDVADDRARRTASRSWRSARRAARRSSPRCCRCWSTGSTWA